jgi:hypothetical protein
MTDVKALAFYLPQFHPTPFNDENWGPGFTEWTNIARGQPRFPGHAQPKIPGELGFYDLRRRGVFHEQSALAQAHGVRGFCMYHYRFGDAVELDLPLKSLLAAPQPQFSFCLCWANESWTRAWDGRSDTLIREQTYGDDTVNGLIGDLVQAMADPRYIRIDGRPVFLIYQIDHIPGSAEQWVNAFRAKLNAAVKANVLLGAVYSHRFTVDMSRFVDFVVQFPPHRIPRATKRALIDAGDVMPFEPERGDYFECYDAVIVSSLEGAEIIPNLVPGVCPNWDNSVRRAKNAHVLVGSTPEKFENWVASAAKIAVEKAEAGAIPCPLLFVNAWNEWAEGAMLEPSWTDRRAYLEAFARGLKYGIL